jgi:hypothetical protein
MRKMADCRRFESDNKCTLTIIGEENEVLDAAAQHAVAAHGHAEGPELREQIRGILESADSYMPGPREPQPLSG